MKSHLKIFLFITLHIKNLKCIKINSVNPLYLIFNRMNGYFEETNRNKCLTLVRTNESNKYEEMWNKIRNLIRSVTRKSDDYDEKYLKMKFYSDDKLPLNKTIEIQVKVLVVRAIYFFFYRNSKYYSQFF